MATTAGVCPAHLVRMCALLRVELHLEYLYVDRLQVGNRALLFGLVAVGVEPGKLLLLGHCQIIDHTLAPFKKLDKEWSAVRGASIWEHVTALALQEAPVS
eukprot:COSAG02_NODE_29787_length_563_cov_0.655172_1_plen_101_part_00